MKNTITLLILTCFAVIMSGLVIAALLFEQQGISGKWLQTFGAGTLIIVAIYDYQAVRVNNNRTKQLSTILCAVILFYPTLISAIT